VPRRAVNSTAAKRKTSLFCERSKFSSGSRGRGPLAAGLAVANGCSFCRGACAALCLGTLRLRVLWSVVVAKRATRSSIRLGCGGLVWGKRVKCSHRRRSGSLLMGLMVSCARWCVQPGSQCGPPAVCAINTWYGPGWRGAQRPCSDVLTVASSLAGRSRRRMLR
jgi:hypothetical protein